ARRSASASARPTYGGPRWRCASHTPSTSSSTDRPAQRPRDRVNPRRLALLTTLLLAAPAAAQEGARRLTAEEEAAAAPPPQQMVVTKAPELLRFVEAPYPEAA